MSKNKDEVKENSSRNINDYYEAFISPFNKGGLLFFLIYCFFAYLALLTTRTAHPFLIMSMLRNIMPSLYANLIGLVLGILVLVFLWGGLLVPYFKLTHPIPIFYGLIWLYVGSKFYSHHMINKSKKKDTTDSSINNYSSFSKKIATILLLVGLILVLNLLFLPVSIVFSNATNNIYWCSIGFGNTEISCLQNFSEDNSSPDACLKMKYVDDAKKCINNAFESVMSDVDNLLNKYNENETLNSHTVSFLIKYYDKEILNSVYEKKDGRHNSRIRSVTKSVSDRDTVSINYIPAISYSSYNDLGRFNSTIIINKNNQKIIPTDEYINIISSDMGKKLFYISKTRYLGDMRYHNVNCIEISSAHGSQACQYYQNNANPIVYDLVVLIVDK